MQMRKGSARFLDARPLAHRGVVLNQRNRRPPCRFTFTLQALGNAVDAWRQSGTMNDPLRTCVHELTHFVHETISPHGLFLQYCRDTQTEATLDVVRALLDAGHG